MKKYDIPILYQSVQRFGVEAENLQDAITKALSRFLEIPDNNYLEDSFEIDDIVEEWYPDEKFDINKAMDKIYE